MTNKRDRKGIWEKERNGRTVVKELFQCEGDRGKKGETNKWDCEATREKGEK